jgi:hypothetical protein
MKDFIDIADSLRDAYKDDLTAWQGSPFLWVRTLSAKKKGAAMEALVRQWCNIHGFPPGKTPGSESDCSVGGVLTEIKGSTLWDSGDLQFNQIRRQNYDMLVLLGISPSVVQMWCPPKRLALLHSKPQHGGEAGTDTYFLKFRATSPPTWLREFGGLPSEFRKALKTQVKIYAPMFPFSPDQP